MTGDEVGGVCVNFVHLWAQSSKTAVAEVYRKTAKDCAQGLGVNE